MPNPLPSGIETSGSASTPESGAEVTLSGGPYRFLAAEFFDQTDVHSELLFEREWLLHPSERELYWRGNAFALEDTLSGAGTVYLKLAPLPDERAHATAWDVHIRGATQVNFNDGDPYQWVSRAYTGGQWGRIAAAHALQNQIRPFHPERDSQLLTNTWGDRGQDAHHSPAFMAEEIEAAARLGADIVQIDDGWQRGMTANSAYANAAGSGAWNGFWAADPEFWSIHPERFPDGLAPLIGRARELGLKFGLWFAPDSSSDGANWEKDAEAILSLHRELGVDFFKMDSVKIESPDGETNLLRFFAKVVEISNGRVTLDLDITAERRFGYFGAIAAGPLFVQNRYTDWANYWPHQTLRVIWKLAHWIPPHRLRMEFLNNFRNAGKYPESPLAPAHWKPDALFAITLFCAPLGWFEVQHLPEEYLAAVTPLTSTWKEHRAAIHAGTILPIGEAPDGAAWTGFVSLGADTNYALVFRELNPRSEWSYRIPTAGEKSANCELLGGQGSARLEDGVLFVEIEEPLGFVWVKF